VGALRERPGGGVAPDWEASENERDKATVTPCRQIKRYGRYSIVVCKKDTKRFPWESSHIQLEGRCERKHTIVLGGGAEPEAGQGLVQRGR